MTETLILVDHDNKQIGIAEKLIAHQEGSLHRAFSIFIFNSKGELLLQQRAMDKYHSAGLWANTCCSHPRDGESLETAIHRRLKEEMGMSCEMDFQFSFIYKANFENGLIEHEYDHVFFGISDEKPILNPLEVMNYQYMDLESLEKSIKKSPESYSEWLKIAMEKVNQFVL